MSLVWDENDKPQICKLKSLEWMIKNVQENKVLIKQWQAIIKVRVYKEVIVPQWPS